MTPLHIISDQIILNCRRLLSGEFGILTSSQEQDIRRILDGSLRLQARLHEFGLTSEHILTIQIEQDFDTMGHISHELRGTLGPIVGFTQMLLMDMSGGELTAEQINCLQRIDDLCAEMESLIFDYFDRERKF